MPELKTRIGINTGTIIAGNIGTKERMNYTIIGDAVNTAERLETMNKIYHTQIIIGEETAQRIGDQFIIRPLDYTELKGRKEKVRIYELMAIRSAATLEEMQLCSDFTRAYNTYHSGQIEEAKALFKEIAEKFPEDFPTQLYLERIG